MYVYMYTYSCTFARNIDRESCACSCSFVHTRKICTLMYIKCLCLCKCMCENDTCDFESCINDTLNSCALIGKKDVLMWLSHFSCWSFFLLEHKMTHYVCVNIHSHVYEKYAHASHTPNAICAYVSNMKCSHAHANLAVYPYISTIETYMNSINVPIYIKIIMHRTHEVQAFFVYAHAHL